jgi:ribosome biogenesis GTPase A
LAARLVIKLSELYPKSLEKRYKIKLDKPGITGVEILEQCARNRGCLIKGGEIDYYRIASIILDEFRGTKIDKISLERPQDINIRNDNQTKGESNE